MPKRAWTLVEEPSPPAGGQIVKAAERKWIAALTARRTSWSTATMSLNIHPKFAVSANLYRA